MYDDIAIILKREEKPVPEKEDEESDKEYKRRLIEVQLLYTPRACGPACENSLHPTSFSLSLSLHSMSSRSCLYREGNLMYLLPVHLRTSQRNLYQL